MTMLAGNGRLGSRRQLPTKRGPTTLATRSSLAGARSTHTPGAILGMPGHGMSVGGGRAWS